jgi:hypothetical protein
MTGMDRMIMTLRIGAATFFLLCKGKRHGTASSPLRLTAQLPTHTVESRSNGMSFIDDDVCNKAQKTKLSKGWGRKDYH